MEKMHNNTVTHEQVVHEKIVSQSEHMQKRMRELGSTALDGFAILPEAINVNESIREELQERIIGQPAAIDAIVEAIDRREARLESDERPVATLAFLGPTGVGKTETAKALSEAMCEPGELPNLIRVDCSEYTQGHEVARLVGAPPGYVGYGQEPVFSNETVEGNTVVLFDEIEKGNRKLHDMLLQIMDAGRLQTGSGTDVSFRDAVVIMTSNLGSEQITEHLKGEALGFAFERKQADMGKIESAANKKFDERFRPEFVNRLTKKVVFHPLSEDSLNTLLDVKLGDCNAEYESDINGCFRVSLSDGAKEAIVKEALERPHEGARPLVRAFDSSVQSTIGRYRGSRMIENGSHLRVFHKDEVGVGGQNEDTPDFVFASQKDPELLDGYPERRRKKEIELVHKQLVKMESNHPDLL